MIRFPLPGVRTTLLEVTLFAWVLMSSVSIVVLHTEVVKTVCGENLTLPCNTTTALMDIKLINWLRNGELLCQKDKTSDECKMVSEDGHHSLVMTMNNISTSHFGKYLCKIHSKSGISQRSYQVIITDCPVTKESYMNGTYAVCRFTDVKFRPKVHWSFGTTDVTDSASDEVREKPGGFFDVSSTMRVTQVHTCSLWNSLENKYEEGQTMSVGSSGSLTAHWTFPLMSLMVLKLTV